MNIMGRITELFSLIYTFKVVCYLGQNEVLVDLRDSVLNTCILQNYFDTLRKCLQLMCVY